MNKTESRKRINISERHLDHVAMTMFVSNTMIHFSNYTVSNVPRCQWQDL